MSVVSIRKAKTHLSKLVDEAVKGHPFVIARAGTPLVKVARISAAEPRRLGFLEGEISVPRGFNRMGAAEVAALFGTEG